MIEVKEEETQVDLLVVVSLVVMNLVAVIPGGESTGGGAVGRNGGISRNNGDSDDALSTQLSSKPPPLRPNNVREHREIQLRWRSS
ncbi:hypothetical protein F444_15435 [Phytophthora nicotianae P1976]|uniref:Uncharacterized protein n=1 Tax=Phytophthora nicotianae P1976 TaxID=1317066 RepID=A0A080ZM32_PHYNI|nr:hypothetical protein F444_15435 [Phytophthora nicotianae P1976]